AGAARLLAARSGGGPDGHHYPAEIESRLPLLHQTSTEAIVAVLRQAGLERIKVRRLAEIDRVERAHQGFVDRTADRWRRYLAVGRAPRFAP
ncbi:MAG TPA: hypothetical protein VIB99_01040, partial [Candidatus Limnocylindrales bacterium]